MPGPPAALARAAGRRSEAPFLFFQRGWDWRWLGFRDARRQVGGAAALLAHLSSGARVAFPSVAGAGGAAAILVDLAIQAAGLVAVPLAVRAGESGLAQTLAAAGAEAFVAPPGFAPGLGLPAIDLPDLAALDGEVPDRAGSIAVAAGSDPGDLRVVPAADLDAASSAVTALLARPAKREIAVVGLPSQDPAERAFLAWGEITGAALVLEPWAVHRVATASWARPTVHCGPAAELAALLAKAGGSRRGRKPPFGRLHTVFCSEPGALGPGEIEAWARLGVAAVPLPALPRGSAP